MKCNKVKFDTQEMSFENKIIKTNSPIIGADGYSFEAPTILPKHAKVASTVSAQYVSLDADNNNEDQTHLLLKGTLPTGHKYIDCRDGYDRLQLGKR